MKFFALFAFAWLGFATSASACIKTVPSVDLHRYVGIWYEIARNPVIFEPKCACARQVLTALDDGKVGVYNTCDKRDPNGKLLEVRGTASPTDASDAKLSVDFGFLWKGDYWVIALDPEYRYAVVTDRFGYSLYILSRTPTLEPSLFEKALAAAQSQVSIRRLKMTQQEGCTYPPIE